MSLTYDGYVTDLANFFPISSADTNFNNFLPGNINYAEQRIYRELDLLATQITDATTQVSSGDRDFTLPGTAYQWITVDQINIITPAATPSTGGTRHPLVATTPEFIDAVFPTGTQRTAIPKFYARRDTNSVVFGPAPDAAYYAELVGAQRPTALSSGNPTTVLTDYLPDLFMAAALVHASGYMKNFGAMSDNPQMAVSWESQYQTLLKSALVEDARATFQSEGWASEQPAPIATPPRV